MHCNDEPLSFSGMKFPVQNEKVQCSVCEKMYSCRASMIFHYRHKHCNMGRLQCPICKRTYAWKNDLAVHMINVHQRKLKDSTGRIPRDTLWSVAVNFFSGPLSGEHLQKVTCPLCVKSYHSRGNMMRHFRHEHSQRDRVECPFCEKTYAWKHDFKIHLNVAHGNRLEHYDESSRSSR